MVLIPAAFAADRVLPDFATLNPPEHSLVSNDGIQLLQHGCILLDPVVSLLNIEQSVLVHGHFPGC